jgi:hypothetical protein
MEQSENVQGIVRRSIGMVVYSTVMLFVCGRTDMDADPGKLARRWDPGGFPGDPLSECKLVVLYFRTVLSLPKPIEYYSLFAI